MGSTQSSPEAEIEEDNEDRLSVFQDFLKGLDDDSTGDQEEDEDDPGQ